MDNFRFDISSDKNLKEAVAIAFSNHKFATHYKEDPEKGLILYWAIGEKNIPIGVYKLPFKLDRDNAVSFIQNWLNEQKYTDETPDFDGSIGPAFRIYNENWGRINDDWYSFVAIKKIEAWYGK